MKRMSRVVELAILAGAMVVFSGCSLLADRKDEIHAAILNYVENGGADVAVAYIDRLVEDGKLGSANAEKLKEAIPQGIEKLKETMKVTEVLE